LNVWAMLLPWQRKFGRYSKDGRLQFELSHKTYFRCSRIFDMSAITVSYAISYYFSITHAYAMIWFVKLSHCCRGFRICKRLAFGVILPYSLN
jgi:hypothetical protein